VTAAVLAELAAAAALCGWHAARWHRPAAPAHLHWLAGRTTAAQRWTARGPGLAVDLALGWAWLAGHHRIVLAVTSAGLAALAVTYTAVPKGTHEPHRGVLPDLPPHAHGL
jgi:hypothetical protein